MSAVLLLLIKDQSESVGHKLNNWEVQDIFHAFEMLPHWKPLIFRARTKMASRDLALRDAFHKQLDEYDEYIKPLDREEYEMVLGAEGDQIEKLMQENQDVLKQLKGA